MEWSRTILVYIVAMMDNDRVDRPKVDTFKLISTHCASSASRARRSATPATQYRSQVKQGALGKVLHNKLTDDSNSDVHMTQPRKMGPRRSREFLGVGGESDNFNADYTQ